MYAIIKTGGKQYRVEEGDILDIERLKESKVDDEVELTALFMADGDNREIAKPGSSNVLVKAVILGDTKGRKVKGLKQKKRSSSQTRRLGHRQNYTTIKITQIGPKS
ncbi:MAG: 50S ribosomal protein L21 [Chlamydiales bacterium]